MKYLKKCKHCQRNFETHKEDKEFCDSNHKAQYLRKQNPKLKSKFVCENCDNEFKSYNKNPKACSRKCTSALQNQKLRDKKYKENEEKFKNVEDIPTCKICGYKSRSLSTHLINHNLTVAQYKEQYNANKSDIFHTSYLIELSTKIQGENNPGYKHGGKFSPYSKKFIKYENLTDAEKNIVIKEKFITLHETQSNNDNYTTNINYYLKQGLSEEDAAVALSKRQTTFSKEICIEKYGKEEGLKHWQNRQEKWLKSYPKSNYSKISQELFKEIDKHMCDVEVYYANKFSDNKNDEYILKTKTSFIKPDFYVPSLSKIIEFDGDYWHQSNNAGTKSRDEKRDNEILDMYPSMNIYHVKEQHYRKNKQRIVEECLEFLQI